ncbi:MAG: hypothetical protein COB49_00580 [Alphaproteobacteria bacterium]|nr:MAG: hypothetical protein COB49_00580 [Alphaproteobacteria bacterium]
MNGNEFLKKVKKIGRKNGVEIIINSKQGKGSHVILHYGTRFTTLKDRRKEIGEGLLKAMCQHLGIKKTDL